jgi:negative modulator of initiation of replication
VKTIEVSDEAYATLQKLAASAHRAPEEFLAQLLRVPPGSPEATDPLAAFVLGVDFRTKFTPADRYLAILGWVASHHPADFGEFVRSLPAGRHYLSLPPEEVLAACRRNQSRQIDGTQFWAIMNLDAAAHRHFLGRVLEFLGYRAEVIEFVCGCIDSAAAARRDHPTAAA